MNENVAMHVSKQRPGRQTVYRTTCHTCCDYVCPTEGFRVIAEIDCLIDRSGSPWCCMHPSTGKSRVGLPRGHNTETSYVDM